MRFHFRASIRPILKNRIFSIVLEAFYPLYGPKTKSVVHSAKYKVIGLKICMQAHFMVVQAVQELKTNFEYIWDTLLEKGYHICKFSVSLICVECPYFRKDKIT